MQTLCCTLGYILASHGQGQECCTCTSKAILGQHNVRLRSLEDAEVTQTLFFHRLLS